ncbi:MAG: hypothetical protein PW788_07255 [Micavibrio sp.]|nr:hypothetical protein [Micavibrio sp.]
MRLAITLLVLSCLLLATPALASSDGKKPEPTPPAYIAMLYNKLLGKAPDFAAWVTSTEQYKEAELYDRAKIVELNSEKMQNTYSLLTVSEPIVLDVTANISGYSPLGKGFLVQNFNDMTYFNYTYMGERYALVPNGMTKYQWLRSPEELSPMIMRETDNGQNAIMTITLTPQAADAKPMQLDGRNCRLIMGEVSKIELWSKDKTHVIWDTQIAETNASKKRLLNLYQ